MPAHISSSRPPRGGRRTAPSPIPNGASRASGALWRIVTQVARRMGFAAAFAYGCAADIFREHAALSAFENGGRRDFDIGALAAMGDDAFDALDPVQWPLRAGETLEHEDRRFFMQGGFYTADRKVRFIAPEPPAPKV